MRAVVIGSGIGGLSAALRLQAMGFATTVLEKHDQPGGRAMVRKAEGFTFDMGPTVLTVPHFIEELFALQPGDGGLDGPDFPADLTRVTEGVSGGPETSRYVTLRPILPFYRIYFDDGTYFDYDGDPERTRAQIAEIEPADLEGYERFHTDAKAIFERGFLELGYTHFGDLGTMLRVAPDLLRLDAVRSLFRFTSRYFRSDKLRQVFSFETLLVGGNPLRVPAIYAMIHFVEKTWGIHYAMGGTGALVAGLVRKLEELGGAVRYGAEVARIDVQDRVATGVTLASGEALAADLVVSNADYAFTHTKLIAPQWRRWNPDWRVKATRHSMSLLVVYFGFRADEPLDLRHHKTRVGQGGHGQVLAEVDRKILADDFSQYLHVPTLTDPSLAPPGHHAAYTLIPVPHNGSGIDWSRHAEPLVQKVLQFLDDRGYIPGLMQKLAYTSFITPDYFEHELLAHLGNAFGPEPTLTQSAWFRPHNRSQDVGKLYLVGAGAQPGAGTPSVMMSAKMTARLIAEDFGIVAEPAQEPVQSRSA